jgi:hypothetical protein
MLRALLNNKLKKGTSLPTITETETVCGRNDK